MRRVAVPFPGAPASLPPQWAEEGGYAFRPDHVERVIVPATTELLALCHDFADRASRDEQIMASLGLPEAWWDAVAADCRARPPGLAQRFDLALDRHGVPKMLELNAENPGDLCDSARRQDDWLRQARDRGWLPDDSRQFNCLDEALVQAFRRLSPDGEIGFVCQDGQAEDLVELSYLRQCADRAGRATRQMSVSALAEEGAPGVVVKRLRWHSLLESVPLARLTGSAAPRVMEPLWSLVMASKAMLPWLWHLHPGHPNLLPAWLRHHAPRNLPARHVVKPRISHRGHNIRIVAASLPGGMVESRGPFADGDGIIQAYQPLRRSTRGDGSPVFAVIGSWVVDGRPCGIAVHEDTSPILMGDSLHFVPHFISSRRQISVKGSC